MNTIIYEGFLSVGPVNFNYSDALLLDGEPVAEELDWLTGKNVTVRYWCADQKASLEEIQTLHMETVMGIAESKFYHCYNEITGYLCTTEDLMIGGHDLQEELRSFAGKYLILSIDYEE